MSDEAEKAWRVYSRENFFTDPFCKAAFKAGVESQQQRIRELESRLRADIELMNIAGIDGPGADKALAEHDARVLEEAAADTGPTGYRAWVEKRIGIGSIEWPVWLRERAAERRKGAGQ